MDVAVMIALAAALWFLLNALQALLGAISVSEPSRSIAVFAYCVVAAIILLFEGGWLLRH